MWHAYPKIIFGTAGQSRCPNVKLALAVGYSGIDTSATPAHNEDRDGQMLAQFLAESHRICRDDLVIQSKYSPTFFFASSQGCPYNHNDSLELQVLKSFQNTATRLNVDKLDVYFLHRPFEQLEHNLRVWSTMEQITKQGGAVRLGICQTDVQTLELLFDKSQVKPAVVQNRFSPQNAFDIDVMQYCARKGMVYQAYGIFSDENRPLLQLGSVLRHAEATDVSPHCALLSLFMALGDTLGLDTSIVDGTRSDPHMKQNLSVVYGNNHPTQQILADFIESLR
ncbi:MAG: hypothetical protein Q9204_002381 [Flavoplaca sp. TL-2023a]